MVDSPELKARSEEVASLLERMKQLNAVGIALSSCRNTSFLLEEILTAARKITDADAGTLYLLEQKHLKFEILQNDSLNIYKGGAHNDPIPFAPIPLYQADGAPNDSLIVVYSAIHDRTVNVQDAYQDGDFDFSGPRKFDEMTGYRSRSFLAVPMKNHEQDIIGVLQLINACDPKTGVVGSFSADDQQLVESLASQAAVALTNQALIQQLEQLFESFVRMINAAIDDKSPYTAGHCARVPVLTLMLADAVSAQQQGPYADFTMSAVDRNELHIAALLHDCGKVTTPVHIVDKATKLESINDRIQLLDTRFEIIRRDLEIAQLRAQLLAASAQEGAEEAKAAQGQYQSTLEQLRSDQIFLHQCNTGGEYMAPELKQRVKDISQRYQWKNGQGEILPILTDNEIYNLCIERGTLTAEEREIINRHVVMTINMLNSIQWPKHLQRVAEYAGGHHERMDGKGYPKGLKRAQMSVQARVMAIADIFEALTARDRPYKPGKKLSEALDILGKMNLGQHVDPDLFDIFIREKVYLRYAQEYMHPEQLDAVDESKIPGYVPEATTVAH